MEAHIAIRKMQALNGQSYWKNLVWYYSPAEVAKRKRMEEISKNSVRTKTERKRP